MTTMYKWNPNVEAVQMDGEWVILQAENNTITRLNETGGLIWSQLQEGYSVDSIVDTLVREFDVTRENATHDVQAFLTELRNVDVISCED